MLKWENGELIFPAQVNEDGTISPAVYNGNTPLTAENLNLMQEKLIEETHKYYLDITETVNSDTDITLPFYYKVGSDCLDFYMCGHLLLKTTTEKEGNYKEIGEVGSISNIIQLDGTSELWTANVGDYFYFVVRGEYSNET